MSGRQAPQPSRWDGLSSSASSSSFASSSGRRRQQLPTGGSSDRGTHRLQNKGNGQSIRPASSAGGSWRRRARASNDACTTHQQPQAAAEDEKAREAVQQLQTSITTILDANIDEGGEGSRDGGQSLVHRSLHQLACSLFDGTDPTKCIDRPPCLNEAGPTKILPNISDDVIWEISYSLLRQMQILLQSEQNNNDIHQFILGLSSISSVCLQSINHDQQRTQKEQSTRIKAMTDLRLCECATILLDLLGGSFYDGGGANDDALLCKSTLFSCLAKVLAISSRNGLAPAAEQKNAKERRGALFLWGAEKTVTLIARQAVLPFLEQFAEGDGDISTSMKVNYCRGAMGCLHLLLQDPNVEEGIDQSLDRNPQLSRHASAILAPLVVDVLHDGRENQRMNPLRPRVMKAIMMYWQWSCQMSELGEQLPPLALKCMAAALNAISVLRKGKAHTKQSANASEIDVATVARHVQSMLQREDLQSLWPTYLNILTLLCSAYPSASANQWHLFLERTPAKGSPLLSIIDERSAALEGDTFEDAAWVALPSALHATSTLLSALPLSLWISGEARASMRIAGGNFASRVRNALLGVMNCTLGLMTATKSHLSHDQLSSDSSCATSLESAMMQHSALAARLCTSLPFNGENSILLQPASNIVECAGDIYVQSVKAVSSQTPSTSEVQNALLRKAMVHFGTVIVSCLESERSTPANQWLAGPSSYEFIGVLLNDESWDSSTSKDRMKMLSSVAKQSPSTLTREPFNLASFCDVCAAQCQSHSDAESRVTGMQLIESFLLGRKSSVAEGFGDAMIASAVSETFSPLLLAALEDQSAAVRARTVSSMGSLLKQDWVDLLLSDVGDDELSVDWMPFDSILHLCSSDKNANVRSSSCKATGDICTVCIGSDDTGESEQISDAFVLSFACKICEAMMTALTDSNAPTRSMALFAIGNTALALKERYPKPAPLYHSMQEMFRPICTCLLDKDEKVAANAIRSISHVAYFVYHPDLDIDSDAQDVYTSLLSALSDKVHFALDDAVGKSPRELTWKQRNGAKKHAWGSCTTLGMLLGCTKMYPGFDGAVAESVMSSLFRCIELSSVINEKIAAAATNALVGLPIALWQHLSSRCNSIGRGLATCFGFLGETKSVASLRADVEALAKMLLASAKKADFCTLFLIQDRVPFSVEYFYQWLVANDAEAGVLEEIAAAVSSPEVEQVLDVSVVQMFLSRSVKHRREGSPCKSDDAPLSPDGDDEEGDEL
ncbi:hypothetical protein ACHAXT_000959 [Thalassiosira profunda]